MIMGLKKILLAGTAMVAVSVLHAGVAQAYVIDNDFTGPNSGTVIASGESITSNADAKHANLNLNNADLIVGGVATGVTITNNNNTLYLYDTGANTTPNTLTLTGPANAIDVAAGQTFNIALGNYSGGDANPSQNTILLVNRNVVIGAGAAINISASTTKKSGHVVEFAEGATTVNLGTGKMTLTSGVGGGTQDEVKFTGTSAQSFTGDIAGTGKLTIGNAHENGVTLNGAVAAKTLAFNANGNVIFKGTTAITDAITLAGTNTLTIGDGVAFTTTGGVSGPGKMIMNGATLNGNVGTVGGSLSSLTLSKDSKITGNFYTAQTTNVGASKLTVDGNVVTRDGDTLRFTVNAPTTAGAITSGGAVTLMAGTKVDVTVDTNVVVESGQKFVLIDGTAGNGVAALTAGNLTTKGTALITFRQDTSSTQDLIVLADRTKINLVSSSTNNSAVGNMLDALGSGGDADVDALQIRLANLATGAEVDAVISTLTPDVSGSTATATIGISTTSSTIINDRIAALRTGIVETGMAAGNAIGMTAARLWGQAFGAQAEQDRRQGIAGYDADTYGMIVGMDADMTDAFRAGIAFSYASTDVDSQNVNTGNTDINSYQIALYGDYDLGGDMFVNAQLGYMRSNIDTLRLNVGGVAGNSARGDFYSNQYIVRAELGRDIRASRNAVLTPSLFVNYNHISFENYTETGAGGLALRNVDTDNMNIFELGVNVKNEWTFMDGMGGYIKPNIHGGFRYDFVNDEVQTSAALVGGGAAFQTTGFEPAKHTINVGAGLSWDAGNNWEVSTNYDFEYKDDYDAHSGYVRVGYKF